jgi:hypothetical protein
MQKINLKKFEIKILKNLIYFNINFILNIILKFYQTNLLKTMRNILIHLFFNY